MDDICDRCGYEAQVRAVVAYRSPETGREIPMCGHHGKRHHDAMKAKGWRVRYLVRVPASA